MLIANFFRQTGHIGDRARTGAWKTEVDRCHTELIGQVKKAQLVLDIGIPNGRALDAVAKRLVMNADGPGGLVWCVDRIPVVDQLLFLSH